MWRIVQNGDQWTVLRDGKPVALMTAAGTRKGDPLADDPRLGDLRARAAYARALAELARLTADGMEEGGTAFESPVLVPEGVRTDGWRVIEPGALDFRDPPLPLMLQTSTDIGHFGAVFAGHFDELSRGENGVWSARGVIHDSEDGDRLVGILEAQGRYGVSVDMVAVDAKIVDVDGNELDDDDLMRDPDLEALLSITKATLAGATATPFPAFADAHIVLAASGSGEGGGDEEMAADGDGGAEGGFEVVGEIDLPVADRDAAWDGDAAKDRVFAMCSDGDDVDVACVSRAFLWRDPDGDGTAQEHYSLGFADVVDGELRIVPGGVAATAGGRGVDAADIPGEDKDRIKTRICSLYERVQGEYDDWPDCPFEDDGMAGGEEAAVEDCADCDSEPAPALAATAAAQNNIIRWDVSDTPQEGASGIFVPSSTGGGYFPSVTVSDLVAGAAPVVPPTEWFDDPGFGDPGDDPRLVRQLDKNGRPTDRWACPPTVIDGGRVFGHIAPWGQCHTAYGECVVAPRSATGYAYFHTGAVTCADGTKIAVGQLTMGCGHPDSNVVTARAAMDHYDGGPGAIQVADVRVGEDEHGIWFAGAIRPDVTDEQVRAFEAQQLSGDWRQLGGNLELIAATAVTVPGFPIRRELAASGLRAVDQSGVEVPSGDATVLSRDGQVVALMAAGMVHRADPTQERLGALEARYEALEARLRAAEAVTAALEGMAADKYRQAL